VKSLMSAPSTQLTLVFESFAFKRGIPVDADYVFDVRMLPNPHYEPALRDLTGLDEPVADFLKAAGQSATDVPGHRAGFLSHWLEPLVRDHRSYVTVAIGCTGGQHRSVYLVEELAAAFGIHWRTLKRHRELDAARKARSGVLFQQLAYGRRQAQGEPLALRAEPRTRALFAHHGFCND
jgi:UPF0042 nucleotide-binding protein